MLFASMLASTSVLAGNEQKRGSAGATELLINPWARSSGMAGAHTAGVKGVEAMNLNIGGLALNRGTELVYSHTKWLSGSDINIHSLGFSQSVGDNGGVIGLSLMSMNLGEIPYATTDMPDQDVTYKISLMNIGLSYAKKFSNSIYGGITVRVISESVPNASAMGVAFDGGVQYRTTIGNDEYADEETGNFRVGVALRNVGPDMKYSGDGLAYRGMVENGNFNQSIEQRTEAFEIPSLLNIGIAYDLNFTEEHRLTLAGNFNSNSFSGDQIQGGVEYGFKNMFMVRGGFDYQKDIFSSANRKFAHTGPTAGATFQLPFGGNKSALTDGVDGLDSTGEIETTGRQKTFGIDYSFRATDAFNGTHSIGLRITL